MRRILGTDAFRQIQAMSAHVRREQQFAFQQDRILFTGVFDVLINDPAGDKLLLFDYKSDSLRGQDPATLIDQHYSAQRLIYALAALGTGAGTVQITYLFVEAPDAPVTITLNAQDRASLVAELAERTAALRAHKFDPTSTPGRFVCDGCPVRGTACPYPYEMTSA